MSSVMLLTTSSSVGVVVCGSFVLVLTLVLYAPLLSVSALTCPARNTDSEALTLTTASPPPSGSSGAPAPLSLLPEDLRSEIENILNSLNPVLDNNRTTDRELTNVSLDLQIIRTAVSSQVALCGSFKRHLGTDGIRRHFLNSTMLISNKIISAVQVVFSSKAIDVNSTDLRDMVSQLSAPIEDCGPLMASSLGLGQLDSTSQDNVHLTLGRFDVSSNNDTVEVVFGSDSFSMSATSLRQVSGQRAIVAASFGLFKGLSSVITISDVELPLASNNSQESHVVDTALAVISAGRSHAGVGLADNMTLTFSLQRQRSVDTHAQCFYLTRNGSRLGFDGCVSSRVNSSHVSCLCDHLTTFGVIVPVHAPLTLTLPELSPVVVAVLLLLSLLAYVVSALSLVCVAGWTTRPHTVILLNLALTDSVGQLAFVFGTFFTDTKVACACVSMVGHVMFLAASGWLLTESAHMYLQSLHVKTRHLLPAYCVLCYGIPVIITVIAAAAFLEGYGTEPHCWLDAENGFQWSFLGPFALITLLNFLLLALVFVPHLDLGHSWPHPPPPRRHSTYDEWHSTRLVRHSAMFTFLLAFTWLLGWQYFDGRSLPAGYLFLILLAAHGCLFLVLHVLLDPQVRQAVLWEVLGRQPDTATSPDTNRERVQSVTDQQARDPKKGQRHSHGHGHKTTHHPGSHSSSSSSSSSTEHARKTTGEKGLTVHVNKEGKAEGKSKDKEKGDAVHKKVDSKSALQDKAELAPGKVVSSTQRDKESSSSSDEGQYKSLFDKKKTTKKAQS